ncbi:MAG: hypothetical protein AB8B72_01060 [Crocinitomicaceae bacterium]
MKVIIIVSSVLFTFLSFSQSSYKVVHIKGDLNKSKTDKNIQIGDQLTKQELIEIKGEKVNCILFNGTEKLTLKANESTTKGRVDQMFASVPERQMMELRGDNDSAYIKISDFFKNDKYLFMDTTESILLNKDYIKDLGNNKFFVIDSEDKKSLIKFEDSILKLEVNKIFKDQEKEKEIKIYSINTNTGVFVKEAVVFIFRLNKEEFQKQAKVIVELLDSTLTTDEKIEKSFSVLEEVYGGLNFQKWVTYYKKNFDSN